jgi:hypothetical protein
LITFCGTEKVDGFDMPPWLEFFGLFHHFGNNDRNIILADILEIIEQGFGASFA